MFADREDAAAQLADAVERAAPQAPVVLALPRGGVPLASVVARRLEAPLDVVLVRKIGMPGQSELAAGAVVDGPSPITLFNEDLLRQCGLTAANFQGRIQSLLSEIDDRRHRYLQGRMSVPLAGRTAILVDDGIATGATIRVAVQALRKRSPAAIWVAVPVAPHDILERLQREVDHVICLLSPRPFGAVGAHYRRFEQVADDDVVRLLQDQTGDPPR